MLFIKLRYYCGQKIHNFTSTFRIRSKLASFLKQVHPDQMNQAPSKIRQQNLRSLKNFNSYIDSIGQLKNVEAKLLKFYIGQKDNKKSKKFYSFTLQLPQIDDRQRIKMNQQKSQKLINNIIETIKTKYQEVKESKNNNKKQEKSIKIQSKENINQYQNQIQRIQRLQQTISPFQKKNQYKRKLEQQQLKNQIKSKYLETQKQNLETSLRKNMSFMDTASNKPMMWSRLIMEQSGFYKDYQQILDSLIDPKLIYFHEDLTKSQIEQFKKKLLPGSLINNYHRDTKIILKICQQMQSYSPPLCFYVSKNYSGDQIPGFFTVPYNFEPVELQKQYLNLQNIIQEEKNKYNLYYQYHLDLLQTLKIYNCIQMELQQFSGNSDISSAILCMKRLQKYKFDKPTPILAMTHEQYRIFCAYYNYDNSTSIHKHDNKIIMLRDFIEQDIRNYMKMYANDIIQ